MCSYIIIIMIKKKLKSILKKKIPEFFCFSMWIMIHFQLQMFLKWKNDRQLWNLNFPGWTHDDDYWPARENSKWYIFKKPRFGTFQSIMIIFYVNYCSKIIFIFEKKDPTHRPSKTTFFAKFSSDQKRRRNSKFCVKKEEKK
jgi:hypothetical protein